MQKLHAFRSGLLHHEQKPLFPSSQGLTSLDFRIGEADENPDVLILLLFGDRSEVVNMKVFFGYLSPTNPLVLVLRFELLLRFISHKGPGFGI